jgi:CRISPR/Cas system CMR-associated protein Cmr5 small subunit
LIQDVMKSHKDIREANSLYLADLKDAQRKWSPERIANLKNLIEELENKNKDLKNKYQKEILKYPEWQVRELRTRRIGWWITKFGKVEVKKGRKFEIKAESLKRVRNLGSRRKINKTIRRFNDIKNNPKAAVTYIMAKSSNIVWRSWKQLYNHLAIRDTWKFDEVFNKQKKKFIDDLFGKMWENATDRDIKIKESIIRRIDYYQDAYKKTMITV